MEKIKNNSKYLFLLALLAGAVFVWYAVFKESRDGLTVAFLDVGQGDAILIDAPNGNQVLIDGGPNKKVLRELSKAMPFYDRTIDMVIATHPDGDHIGGLPEVLNRFSVDFFVEPGVASESAVYEELETLVEKKNIRKVLARRGMKINLAEGTYLLILFPNVDVSDWDANDASIVAKLVYGDTSFLLTGDSPQKIENYLVSVDKENLDVDVLKAGHHGSKTSSSESFVGYSSPEYAIISVGKENKYGHPNKGVLEILEKFGVRILRTDEMGSVTIGSDGHSVFLEN